VKEEPVTVGVSGTAAGLGSLYNAYLQAAA
jgi:hypothetical protein